MHGREQLTLLLFTNILLHAGFCHIIVWLIHVEMKVSPKSDLLRMNFDVYGMEYKSYIM